MSSFLSSQVSSERGGWVGNNAGGYVNPAFDDLYTRSIGALDGSTQQGLQADLLKLAADQAIFIPTDYWIGTATVAVRKGVRGPGRVYAGQLASTGNVAQWEMD